MKQLFIFITSIAVSPVVKIIEKYVFDDWEFLGFLMVLILFDTVLGFWKHYKRNTISSDGFGDFFSKIAVYGSMLILCHVATHFEINDKQNIVFNWLPYIIYSGIILREGISYVENLGAINEKWVPTGLLKKLKEFDNKGKFKV